ncbi:MAG: hypothetical protein HY952_03315 [Elusimicrobia bacterium]|nr:hypothetical protein [Elusimicrobiota bacterium]
MNFKLRIKHPSGAEFEAEGPAEFIQAEKNGFLRGLSAAGQAGEAAKHHEEQAGEPAWDTLAEAKGGLLILRNKHQSLKAGDAALMILAAEKLLNKTSSVGAIALSKAIKASGYAPERIDRLLAKANREGLLKASGTKRNRAYQITDRGLERAWLEARKLI